MLPGRDRPVVGVPVRRVLQLARGKRGWRTMVPVSLHIAAKSEPLDLISAPAMTGLAGGNLAAADLLCKDPWPDVYPSRVRLVPLDAEKVEATRATHGALA